MRAEVVEEIIAALRAAGMTFACYLPDSWLADVERRLHEEPGFTVVPVVNEGEGVAMCAGLWLGGRGAVMLMENSGVRVACEELARLSLGPGVPVFMLMPYRGDPGGPAHLGTVPRLDDGADLPRAPAEVPHRADGARAARRHPASARDAGRLEEPRRRRPGRGVVPRSRLGRVCKATTRAS